MKTLNYGKLFTWAGALLSFSACVGYLFARDWRRAGYFFFAGCLNVTLAL